MSDAPQRRLPSERGELSWTELIELQNAGTRRFENDAHVIATAGSDHRDDQLPLLGGWTAKHLVAHVAQNAIGLRNLLTWARTGVETPMYPDPQTRDRNIEQGARRAWPFIVSELTNADRQYAADIEEFPSEALSTQVRTALGRTITARHIPWLRVREVWVHASDLDVGTSFSDFPRQLAVALIDEAVARFESQGVGAGISLSCDDDPQLHWKISGPTNAVLHGALPALLAYLLRGVPEGIRTDGGPVPQLSRWL